MARQHRREGRRGNVPHPPVYEGRWEFIGVVADEKIRKRYHGKSVAAYFPKGNQNPVKYVNCDRAPKKEERSAIAR